MKANRKQTAVKLTASKTGFQVMIRVVATYVKQCLHLVVTPPPPPLKKRELLLAGYNSSNEGRTGGGVQGRGVRSTVHEQKNRDHGSRI